MKKLSLILSCVFVIATSAQDAYAALSSVLDTVVVTASRIEQEGHRVAGNVTVITNEQIQDANVQSVPELLGQVEGVFGYDFSTVKTSTVDIRGFGDTANRNVLVLIDGRRLNLVDSGAADLVQVPIGAVERVEIIRGASSVLYGDNAVGGVINIITKKGKGKLNGRVGTVHDAYGTTGQHVEVNGEAQGLSYYVFGNYLDKRGYRKNADELHQDVSARFDYQVTDKTSIGLQYGYHDDKYELPGGLNQTEIVTLGRRGSADSGNIATTEDQYVKLTMNIDPLPEDEYLGHIVVDTSWRDRKLFDVINSFNFITHRDVQSKGVTGKYIFDQEILNRKVDFVVGLDYYDHENDILGTGSNSDDITISREDLGAYTNLQFETIDDLFLIGGARYYKAEYTINQRSGTPNFIRQKPDEFVTSGGLKYEYGKGSNVYFNYQQTFRFLTTNEWYSSFSGLNTGLKQQTGDQFELGVKHNFKDKAIVSVTPYLIDTENEIFFDPSQGFFGSNSNYDKIRRVGVEIGTRLDIKEFLDSITFFDKLEYFTNYTYQNPEFRDGSNDGKDVPFVPNHQVSAGLVANFLKYYKMSLQTRYVGSRYAINDTGNELPKAKPYIVTDLNLAYERNNFEIFLKVNNLFDQKYETYHATNVAKTVRDVFPAPEKHLEWGVTWKF